MEFLSQIESTIDRFALYSRDSALILMVSGGADSVALLRAFASEELPPCTTFEVLHVNHGLRGVQADKDAHFVEDMCQALGVRCHIVSCDVAAYAHKHELNLEDAGRIIRYREANVHLDRLCIQRACLPSESHIVTAHTLDDRIETFFWRALWGAGTGALGSTAAVRENVIRPLIATTREEIEAYLDQLGQPWCEDATNQDISRIRAAIRHALVPVCEQIRPTFRRSLQRTMDLAAGDNEVLERMERAFARDFVRQGEEDEQLDFIVPMMRTLDSTMRARTVRCALFEAFPEARRIGGAHIDALVEAFDCDSFARDLGYGLRATLKYDTLRITKTGEKGECGE